MSKLKILKNEITAKLFGPNILLQIINSRFTNKQTKEFYKSNLAWPVNIAMVLGRPTPRYDRFLLRRKPQLKFEGIREARLIKISEMYLPENEVREDNEPYKHFANSLFNSSVISPSIRNIMDVGCTSGNLIFEILKLDYKLEVNGIEAFSFFKNIANREISENIKIVDMRNPMENTNQTYDLVICTEVGEHIDPSRIDVFLQNLKKLSSNLVVISWSATFPPPSGPPQHLSVLRFKELSLVMKSYGFILVPTLTKKLNLEMKNGLNSNHHWLDSLSVWKKIDQNN